MNNFSNFLGSFSQDSSKKGRQFEQFIKWFLVNDNYWKSIVSKVYFYEKSPIRWSNKDIGTDLIFQDHEGRYWAVQAKNYSSDYSISKKDVDSFLSDTTRKKIYKRLLICTTNKISNNALKTINETEKGVVVFKRNDFEDRGNIYPKNFSSLIKSNLKNIPKPRKHQLDAITNVVKNFKKNNKGQLIMACGTGKTYTCYWIHKKIKAKKTLVLVPSLNLMSQTLREWILANGSSFKSLCVCSDPSTIKNIQDDEIILEKSDLPYSVTWDVNEIRDFLKKNNSYVIFSTYQSSPLISQAQKKLKNHKFDLSIADEAHRVAGKIKSTFATILDDKKIKSEKKLFTTATPRIYSESIKKAFGAKDIEIRDMDDEKLFGNVFHSFQFSQAIKSKLLADYKVIVIGVDKDSTKEMIQKKELISIDKNKLTDLKSLSIQIGLIKAIKNFSLNRLITFHGRVKKARDFSQILPSTYDWIKPKYKQNRKLIIDYVKGEMPTHLRREKIKILEKNSKDETKILSNARCLGEGIDIPALEGISFIDPKKSDVDIVQCVGRAIRKPNKDKKYGYIILPVFIETNNKAEIKIEDSDFKYVWAVLNALKSHDDVLKFELDSLRTKLGKSGVSGKTSKVYFDLPKKINKSFQDKINTALIESVTESWFFYFGLLQRYYKEFKTAQVPATLIYKGVRLGGWVRKIRYNYTKNKISRKEIEELESTFKDWSWKPIDDQWLEKFNILKEYYSKYKRTKVSDNKIYKGINLSNFIIVNRGSYKRKTLSDEKIKLFEVTFKDWSWKPMEDSWVHYFNILKKYYNNFKTSRVQTDKYMEKNLEYWIRRQRQLYKKKKLERKLVVKLEKTFEDWSWDPIEDQWNNNFNKLKEYKKNYGNIILEAKLVYKKTKLGNWITKQRGDYKRGRLSKKIINMFEKTFEDWSWDPIEDQWFENLELLKDYYSKFKTARVEAKLIYKNVKIGGWVRKQRNDHKKKFLSNKKVKLIEKNFKDWSWDPIEDQWVEVFNMLKVFYKTNKKLPKGERANKKIPLVTWIEKQRSMFKKNKLDKNKIDLLTNSFKDWSWDPVEDLWFANFNALKDYYKVHNTVQFNSIKIYKNFKLGQWVQRQRQTYKKKKLPKNKIRMIENSFKDWTWRLRFN